MQCKWPYPDQYNDRSTYPCQIDAIAYITIIYEQTVYGYCLKHLCKFCENVIQTGNIKEYIYDAKAEETLKLYMIHSI